MRTGIIISISVIITVLAVLLWIGVATKIDGGRQSQSRLNRGYVTYSSRDKAPFGSYVPYKLMQQFFKDAKPKTATRPFVKTYQKTSDLQLQNAVYIIVARRMWLTEADAEAMAEFVSAGNKLFLAVEETDSLLETTFGFKVKTGSFIQHPTTVTQHFSNPNFGADTTFTAPRGIQLNNSLAAPDSGIITALGTNKDHLPNFFRVPYGNGQVYVMLNPMTWTNYFLMKNDNIRALELQMAYLPEYPSSVYWDEFYKHQDGPQQGDFSNWQVLMRHPSLRWALILAVVLLLLYVLFEGKRRQRLIPPKPALANNSLDFAETLGRLYYLHHNNANLANKMTTHLMDYIRQNYYLNTSAVNAEFITALSRKSGHTRESVERLLTMAGQVRLADSISDEQLQDYYNSIYQFYLKAN
ncbi:DUF4350 domain-containing protein [Chitinophaga sp. GCM10012297]|uniref:DUF4350 domain-containing protein n=1 Tax=Chitinophaga chungangae TaxID=2821488 RepID=A0ABS3YEI3_9BACT|nr:DUF4350 domain-containing protein [Chitinophaga chungangae]MBO9153089.1 DUF4350 domain-containing protein [Chitinophaga chungangae]